MGEEDKSSDYQQYQPRPGQYQVGQVVGSFRWDGSNWVMAGAQPGDKAERPSHTAERPRSVHGLLDVSFRTYATPDLAKYFWIWSLILSVIAWPIAPILLFATPYTDIAVYWLFFGWVPLLANLVQVRLVLEFLLATVRTAMNTKA